MHHLKQNVVVTTFYISYYFSEICFLCPCRCYVDFPIVATFVTVIVIMQCTAADLKDVTTDDGLVGYILKYVVITGVIELIGSTSIIADDVRCGM